LNKILIVGFGNVGQAFFELFHEKRKLLRLEDTAIYEISSTTYGHIKNPSQLTIDQIKAGKLSVERQDAMETIRESEADIVCEFTQVNIKDGEPASSHIRTALECGKNVITTNKGPMALHYEELTELAMKRGVQLKFKGTVMAGTPSFNLLKLLPGAEVQKIRGIFNGTTNFILSEMAKGKSFGECLALAQSMGIAEADSSMDIDGFDSALKAIIFSKVIGWSKHNLGNMEIKGIRGISITDGHCSSVLKLLVSIDKEEASVKPTLLSQGDPLASVDGLLNAVEITTDTLGKIISIGPGAGRTATAQAVMTDLMEIVRTN
jgi:homoserine dehydrogenase